MDRVVQICEKHGMKLIEDCARVGLDIKEDSWGTTGICYSVPRLNPIR